MKKLLLGILTAAMLIGLAGCDKTVSLYRIASDSPLEAPGNYKVGEACITNILGFVATGDASVRAAALNGGIVRVATVDVIGEGGLFVGKVCTFVTGS